MKKLLALALCLVLLAGAGAPAAAAPAPATRPGTSSSDGAMTERLKAITLKVKETLGIGDGFTSFTGNLDEVGAVSLWSLNWSGEGERIYVRANENGTVVSYNNDIDRRSAPRYSGIPRFPAMSLDDAKVIAVGFLARVLDQKTETADLIGTSVLDYSGDAMFYLNGPMKLRGLETPVNISVSVGAASKQVVSFYRGDSGQDYSGASDPSAATDKAAAADTLRGTQNMKLTYALPGDGTHTARLQYTPNPGGSFVVDATTGKLVDLSKLDYGTGSPSPYPYAKEASSDAAAGGLGRGADITPTEQATIDQLQGVLSQSALESRVRVYAELGLEGFKLQNVNYYTYKSDGEQTRITANLQFAYTPKSDTAQYRYISMDALTGKLLSVSGSIAYTAGGKTAADYNLSSSQTEAVARSFAGKILPDQLKETVLLAETTTGGTPPRAARPTSSAIRTYIFSRAQNGITFPENSISVGVDANTGFVSSFYYSWYDYDVTFVSPAGAITADAAATAYMAGAGTVLRYTAVPASLQPSGLLLSYTTADSAVWGVNALTGALLKASGGETDTALKYSDLAGNPHAAMIEKLAAFGIGFSGGVFKPTAVLTQLDALSLIESTNGRKAVPLADAGATADIYNMAYSMGILTPDEKNPDNAVTRAEFVKYLVNAMGFKEAALLQGIYKPGFSDDASILNGNVGYIALGKGFGILQGDQNGNCRPNDSATRAEAAVMLYNCMSRS